MRAALRQVGGSWRQDVDLARALAGPLAAAGAALAAGDPVLPAGPGPRPGDRAARPGRRPRGLRSGCWATRHPDPGRLRPPGPGGGHRVDPIGAALRAEEATARRQVTRRRLPDGQAGLEVTGPAPAIAAIWAVPTRRAGLTHPDDPRTLDQRRFDALLDICRTAATDDPLANLTDGPDHDDRDDPATRATTTGGDRRRPRRRLGPSAATGPCAAPAGGSPQGPAA